MVPVVEAEVKGADFGHFVLAGKVFQVKPFAEQVAEHVGFVFVKAVHHQ